jgi:hypothetical protein
MSDEWWNLFIMRLMSDDHFLGERSAKYRIDPQAMTQHYAHCGLQLDPSRFVITEVQNFREDINKHSILGFKPLWSDEHSCFVPTPSYREKYVAAVLTRPVKLKPLLRMVCALAFLSYFDIPMFSWLKSILDSAIAEGDIKRSDLTGIELDGVKLVYPDEKTVLRIFLGYSIGV